MADYDESDVGIDEATLQTRLKHLQCHTYEGPSMMVSYDADPDQCERITFYELIRHAIEEHRRLPSARRQNMISDAKRICHINIPIFGASDSFYPSLLVLDGKSYYDQLSRMFTRSIAFLDLISADLTFATMHTETICASFINNLITYCEKLTTLRLLVRKPNLGFTIEYLSMALTRVVPCSGLQTIVIGPILGLDTQMLAPLLKSLEKYTGLRQVIISGRIRPKHKDHAFLRYRFDALFASFLSQHPKLQVFGILNHQSQTPLIDTPIEWLGPASDTTCLVPVRHALEQHPSLTHLTIPYDSSYFVDVNQKLVIPKAYNLQTVDHADGFQDKLDPILSRFVLQNRKRAHSWMRLCFMLRWRIANRGNQLSDSVFTPAFEPIFSFVDPQTMAPVAGLQASECAWYNPAALRKFAERVCFSKYAETPEPKLSSSSASSSSSTASTAAAIAATTTAASPSPSPASLSSTANRVVQLKRKSHQ